jgi:hypothetical protein
VCVCVCVCSSNRVGRLNRLLHAINSSWLLAHNLIPLQQLVLSLLVHLDNIAAGAAKGLGEINRKVALQTKAPVHLGALEDRHDEVAQDARAGAESDTGCVDGGVALQGGRVVEAMVGAPKGYARTAAGEKAGFDWVEAVEEAAIPGPMVGGLRASDGSRVCGCLFDAAHPVRNIIWLLRGRHWGGLAWSLVDSGHFCCVWVSKNEA